MYLCEGLLALMLWISWDITQFGSIPLLETWHQAEPSMEAGDVALGPPAEVLFINVSNSTLQPTLLPSFTNQFERV